MTKDLIEKCHTAVDLALDRGVCVYRRSGRKGPSCVIAQLAVLSGLPVHMLPHSTSMVDSILDSPTTPEQAEFAEVLNPYDRGLLSDLQAVWDGRYNGFDASHHEDQPCREFMHSLIRRFVRKQAA